MVQCLSYKASSHISLPFFHRFVDRFGKRRLAQPETSLWGCGLSCVVGLDSTSKSESDYSAEELTFNFYDSIFRLTAV